MIEFQAETNETLYLNQNYRGRDERGTCNRFPYHEILPDVTSLQAHFSFHQAPVEQISFAIFQVFRYQCRPPTTLLDSLHHARTQQLVLTLKCS